MKYYSLPIFIIYVILTMGCGSDSKKTESSQNKTPERKLSLPPNLEVEPEMDNGTITSPSETPMNIIQEFNYKNSDGEMMLVKYTFDGTGNAVAILMHPSEGEIVAHQDGEAAAKNMEYKSSDGTEWHVANETATLKLKGQSSTFTLIK